MTHGTSPDEDGMGQTNGASSEISFPANTPFQFSFVGSNSTGHAPFVNFQSTSNAPTGNPSNTSTFMTGGRKTNNSFQLLVDSSNNGHQFREIDSSGSETLISSGTDFDGATTLMTRDTNGTVRLYKNGSLQSTSSVQVTDAMIIAMGGTVVMPLQHLVFNIQLELLVWQMQLEQLYKRLILLVQQNLKSQEQ